MDDIDLYIELTGDLLKNELVESMKRYNHHGTIDTHFQSVYVSYTVMKTAKAFHMDNLRDIVRAALLHDFYLYEWYTEKHEEYHIWYHPKESVKNIEKYLFDLTPMQRNMILSHMFPTYVERPKYAAAWVLTLSDKRCATQDYFKLSKRFLPIYNEINRRTEKI